MQITILGSGPSLGIPRAGCRCLTCRDARRRGSRSQRRRSSALIKFRNRHILIDASPDIAEQFARARLGRVDAVCLTHAHADAAGGVNILASILRAKKEKPFALYAEQNTLRRILKITTLYHARPKSILVNIVPNPIKPYHSFSVFGLTFKPLRVAHAMTPGFPTVGYLLGKKFAYLSDVSQIPPKSFKLLKGVKTLVLDAAMWFRTKMPAHLNTEESILLGQKLGVGRLYLTQIGHGYPPHKKAVQEIKKFCRKQKITFEVILAYDGMRIKI